MPGSTTKSLPRWSRADLGARPKLEPGPFRVDVLGVGISTMTPQMALDIIAGWIDRRERNYVCVTGVHGVMESQRDAALLAIHNSSGLTVPDGMPMVWSGQRAGASWMRRVYGPDLMRAACEVGAARGWRMFLYGATEEVLDRLSAHLLTAYPDLQVVGRISPPFRPLGEQERLDFADQINRAQPDIVWVGLSTPKQERWMDQNREILDAPVLIGVGAAFDLVSGAKRQAPGWLQRAGLEWAFRLATEPRRLWKRYAKSNPAFVLAVARRPPRLRPDSAASGSAAAPRTR
jgi:N-acetylglucosaminyldiphosphoundecaprenol N-acetyl-beta-D-mannosaminyltransferase